MGAGQYTSFAKWTTRGRRWRHVAIVAGACVGLLAGLLFVGWNYRVVWWPTSFASIELVNDEIRGVQFVKPQEVIDPSDSRSKLIGQQRFSIDRAVHITGPFQMARWSTFANVINVRIETSTEATKVVAGLWMPLAVVVLTTAFSATRFIILYRRSKPGRCRRCRYDMNSIPGAAVCPECGLPVAAASPTNAGA